MEFGLSFQFKRMNKAEEILSLQEIKLKANCEQKGSLLSSV